MGLSAGDGVSTCRELLGAEGEKGEKMSMTEWDDWEVLEEAKESSVAPAREARARRGVVRDEGRESGPQQCRAVRGRESRGGIGGLVVLLLLSE